MKQREIVRQEQSLLGEHRRDSVEHLAELSLAQRLADRAGDSLGHVARDLRHQGEHRLMLGKGGSPLAQSPNQVRVSAKPIDRRGDEELAQKPGSAPTAFESKSAAGAADNRVG